MGSKDDWVSVAKKELGGKGPFEILTKSWDEFKTLPYYNESDLRFTIDRLSGRQSFPFGAPNHWFNLPQVDCSSTANPNSIILNHLQRGADGVFLKVDGRRDSTKIFTDVKPEFCFLGFECDDLSISFFEKLTDRITPDKLNGAIFWTSEPKWLPIANLFKGYRLFRCFGIHERGNSAVEQLANFINTAISVLDHLTDYAFSALEVFNQLAFTIQSTNNFFGDIVRIRSLRILLSRLSMAYGLESVNAFIRVKVNPIVSEQFQPHGDLLGNSFATISAVASSADAITVITTNDQSTLHTRLARNISLLLKEESRLDKVVDPFAGSYFIESLTKSLVEKVWNQLTAR